MLELLKGSARNHHLKEDVKAVILGLGAEDAWFVFRSTADTFLKAYAALCPDARVLPYRADLQVRGRPA
ncbi:MAG: hypothetical protein AUK47_14030 [Deltaproteobacteria bacterium CG2_30_63_29]|nr:MAG: hypothetical protein AUK47_14030 [Deltaproteobacteria bacterium CG2_30_63_29]PJB39176.1 MAG: hypothetical protein CO108_17715 [Deltaproteobacteria bacterium CG_4_9_14_3_um_filter_63_12]